MRALVCVCGGGGAWGDRVVHCLCRSDTKESTCLLRHITTEKSDLCEYTVCITRNTMWRHQVTFGSLTITMIGITVFSETMNIFSTLKHFWIKKMVSVMRNDAD